MPLYSNKTHIGSVVGNLGYSDKIIVNAFTNSERPYTTDTALVDGETVYVKGHSIEEMLKNGDLKQEIVYANADKTQIIGACGITKSGYFLTYDTPEIVAAKAKYASDNGYGGLIFWSGNGDVGGELVAAAHNVFTK